MNIPVKSLQSLLCRYQLTYTPLCQFHASQVREKAKAGRYKVSKMLNKPLTYDQAFKPNNIGVTKGWLSAHTGNLHGEKNAALFTYEDALIRKFISGTFYRMFHNEIIIKRRFNIIEVTLFSHTVLGARMAFLKGYSEKLLSALLKCNVKLQIYRNSKRDSEYKYI